MSAMVENYFGIDFGTTCSATVGYSVADDRLEPSGIQYGDNEGRPVPSVVAIDRTTGEVITGREAWDRKAELSGSCRYIESVKSIMDSDEEWEIAGRVWNPVLVASELFKALKAGVRDRTGAEMDSATVAIPIGFSPEKRRRLRKAARLAGITINSFVSEPTAAFFANYQALKSSSVVAVFDWGGGTLDVSVLRNEGGRISELATSGRNRAGDYIDNKIAQRIHTRIARKKGREIAFGDMPHSAQDKLRVRVESAKRALGDDDTATIAINSYGEYGVCRETLDYDWFAEIIAPEVDMALECLKETIDQSGVGLANIDRIVLVGGSSNLRPLLDRMERLYGDKIFAPEESMWNVGDGAARLAMTPGTYCSNQSVGIVLSDSSFFELLSPDEKLDSWTKTCRFGIVDTSREARFVFGGSPDIEESSERFRTLEIPAYRFLQEQIEVSAVVDEDMVFRILARSTMRPKEFARVWEYPRLKCYYRLPGGRA